MRRLGEALGPRCASWRRASVADQCQHPEDAECLPAMPLEAHDFAGPWTRRRRRRGARTMTCLQQPPGAGSCILIPLSARGRTLGVLTLLMTERSGRDYTSSDLRFFEVFAGRVALALDNAGLFVELQTMEAQLSGALGSLSEAVTIQNVHGNLIYANQAAAEMMGLATPSEVLAQPSDALVARYDFYHEDGSRLDPQEFPGRRVLAGGEAESLVMRVFDRQTGEQAWRLTKASAVTDSAGRVTMVVNVIADITAVKRAELAQRLLAQAGELFSSSLELKDDPATRRRPVRAPARRLVHGARGRRAAPVSRVGGGCAHQSRAGHACPGYAGALPGRGGRSRRPCRGLPDRSGALRKCHYRPDARRGRKGRAAPGGDARTRALRHLDPAADDAGHDGRGADARQRRVTAGASRITKSTWRPNSRAGRQAPSKPPGSTRNGPGSPPRCKRACYPTTLPALPGWTAASLYLPAGQEDRVGGDFYEAIRWTRIPGCWSSATSPVAVPRRRR